MLERIFRLQENNTDVKTELIAGLTTFMTMAYIIFVNPNILQAAGLPLVPTIAATALAAAIPTLLMGFYTNYPFALASGMGLNAVLAFSVVKGMNVPWQTAMGIVFIEGAIITILVLTRIRESVMHAIPLSLKRAIGVGIGLLIAYIGMQQAGWVVGDSSTLTSFGSFHNPSTLVSTCGLIIILVLMAWRIKGAILLGILITTGIALSVGVGKLPEKWVALPDFSTFAKLDIVGALELGLLTTIFAFLITDFFDTMGTVIAVGGEAGYLTADGRLPRLNRVLLVDSLAAVWGSICSASSVTTYIESASGVSAGGRTGLTAVVVGLLFLLAVFFAPAISIVPAVATAPALIVVGFLLMAVVCEIPFGNLEESFPAFLTVLVIPLTLSISRGIGYGFIAYTLVKIMVGKWKELHPLMIIVSALFALSFALQK
ncbi:MAG: NCS2 family permease [Armatimonadota bacterium]|nr:NCS2 family permease [Armatimonadota bacterium]